MGVSLRLILWAFLLTANLNLFPNETALVPYTSPLPSIGKWMQIKHGGFAHWLGQHYRNKELREPINIIIVDRYSPTRQDAIKALIMACRKAGYKEVSGHSSGYFSSIDDIIYPQIPSKTKTAFANHVWYKTNNHGRIFGPAQYGNSWVFTGAFSRESFALFNRVHHLFLSFADARNDFSQRLNDYSNYQLLGTVPMDNSINTDTSTTADHDGNAVLLVLKGQS